MKIYSPIYPSLLCKQIGNLNIPELKRCYEDGFGLGLDLFKCLEDQSIKIFRCPESKYNFYYPFNLAGDSEYYKKLENRNPNYYNSDSWEFYKTISLLNNESVSILEIGSGNLSFLKLIKIKSKNIVGLELNENAVIHGEKEGIKVYNTTIEEFSTTNSEKFDIVCAFQVLEHVQNIDSFILGSLKCLKSGGHLIFAVPNNRSIFFKKRKLLRYYSNQNNYRLHCTTIALNAPPHHMGLWDKKSLKQIAKKYSIKIESIHNEPIKQFRYGLVKDILISNLTSFLGLKLSRFIVNFIFKNRIIKKLFLGDSILIVYSKK